MRKLSVLCLFLVVSLIPGIGSAQSSTSLGNDRLHEIQVRGLPPAGQAWSATRPIQNLPRTTLQAIDMDRSVLRVRSRGLFSPSALKRAVRESGLTLVYINEVTP